MDATETKAKRAKARLIPYVGALLGLFLTLEVFARFNAEHFFALSDKILLKVQILKQAPDTRVLFLGSSRFLDAIDARTFAATMKREADVELKTFNGATTGLNIERYSYFARVASEQEGLTHVVLEASKPALIEGELGFVDDREAAAVGDAPKDLEGGLRQAFDQNISLVRYRKALRPKVLLKLLVLHTADAIDPDIWSRKGTLKQIFYRSKAAATDEQQRQHEPTIIRADANGGEPATEETKQMLANMRRVAGIFRDAKVKVIWMAPPVAADQVEANSNTEITACYRRVAREFDTVFFDYAARGFEAELRRDPTHLNTDGRRVFSEIFATHLAKELGDDAF